MFNAYVSGFTLVCFVLGLLVSHPKTPVDTNVMFPKLSGESAYSLMALLGTNIIVHNFYTHSSVVQVNFQHPILVISCICQMTHMKLQLVRLALSIIPLLKVCLINPECVFHGASDELVHLALSSMPSVKSLSYQS
jgi:Mn2+/Fe2+ NRAMP family transporter